MTDLLLALDEWIAEQRRPWVARQDGRVIAVGQTDDEFRAALMRLAEDGTVPRIRCSREVYDGPVWPATIEPEASR